MRVKRNGESNKCESRGKGRATGAIEWTGQSSEHRCSLPVPHGETGGMVQRMRGRRSQAAQSNQVRGVNDGSRSKKAQEAWSQGREA
eukprot:177557-Chlamydomonas_euryale.AAC.10